MDNRREFLKKAALLTGAAGVFTLPASIQKALAINPDAGTTYLDAEHIVFLMQENRSFDHTYGTLQGVRGFNDPRVITQPNNNLVWLQTNAEGETYAPFRLNIKDTKITWMGSLPHSWANQVDARNNGRYDKWLDVKKSSNDDYKHMPLTMGYYTREDIPFYYALADAFTVCDQSFCSSLTGTTPNRLYFWTGTIREEQHENSQANVWNEEADYDTMVTWKTFPERLEDEGISWKIYQNDISVDGGYTDEQDDWMSNFGDNSIEYFTQYHVKLSTRYINYLQKQLKILPGEIKELEDKLHASTAKDEATEKLNKTLDAKKALFEKVQKEAPVYTKEKYDALSAYEKSIHEKAFTDNRHDADFYKLTNLVYEDGDAKHEINIPEGDVLHQFREDVNNGRLPTVSWLVAPEKFSDHPSSAWFGAWYVSETLDILTKNPDIWKKTIFILTYDENDGYFDHVPPFVAPNQKKPFTGKTSQGIDTGVEFVTAEQESNRTHMPEKYRRESSIGLGYRVPLVIASPWSRGGWVNSQVFDHTSSLQFLEEFLNKKTGKKITETNISNWRRAVCGDLTSVFRPYNKEKIKEPEFVAKKAFIESIHKAKFKEVPDDYKNLTADEIADANKAPRTSTLIPNQEAGIRTACALPYELYADGNINADKKTFDIHFNAKNEVFGNNAAGSAFTVYVPVEHELGHTKEWSYALEPGTTVEDTWKIDEFENGNYNLYVYGPNGFFRCFKGDVNDPALHVATGYEKQMLNSKKLSGNIEIKLLNKDAKQHIIEIIDNAYKCGTQQKIIGGNKQLVAHIDTSKSHGWYDFSLKIKGNNNFEKRYAGRVETGEPTKTDPVMGRV